MTRTLVLPRRQRRAAAPWAARLAIAASVFLSAAADAQPPAATHPPVDTAYQPSMRLPRGSQVVAVYLGSTTCGPCQLEATKAAIRRMKPLVAAQAQRAGAAFAAAIVSTDWDLQTALRFVQPLGAFDEYLLGANWAGSGVQHYLRLDTATVSAIPQVLVVERSVESQASAFTFGPERVLKRVVGAPAIAEWVRSGAPITP